jgi:type VI secretion system protein ImpL
VADSDLPLVVPALDILRGIAEGTVAGQSAVPAGLGWGLYQGRVIRNDARLSYRAALNRHLLPRLLLRLEEFMQANANAPESLHEALKVYLMLGQMGPLARDQITEWFRADWELVYPGIARDPLRQALAAHLDALTGQPMQAIELNNDVVAAVREIVTTMPQAQRVYNGIVSSEAATALPRWRLTDIGGPNLARAVTRSSGKALNEGIEGIYTYEGFHAVFLDQVGSVAARIKRDAWVLGEAAGEPTETALIALARDVLDLYYNDFIQRYDTLLGDIDIIPMESLSHAAEVTNVLSGPTSPIVNILNAVNHETRLTEDRPAPGAAAVADAASGALGGQAGAMARSRLSLQSQIFIEALQRASAQPGQPAPPKPGAYVEDRFSWLNDLVTRPEGGASPLEGLIGTLTEVYQELNRLNFAGGVSAGQTGDSTAIARFVQEAGRIEGPLQRWATQIATGSSGITAEGTRAGLSARWQASVLPFCEQATKDVYPFNRRARADIAMKDFATLFGPGGQIDAFFAENLANIVDTRARPWAWKRLNDADLGISPAVLTQFQMAAEIRDAFFGTAPQPEVKFQITPEALSEDARAMTLEIDGTSVTYRHGDGVRPVAVTWPGAVGLARMQFDPPRQGSEAVISRDGPWGWFRLLDAAEIRRTNVSDRSRLIFNFGGRTAIFQMQSGSVVNPFALPALSKFSCPKSF